MKKLLIAMLALALAFGASRLVLAEGSGQGGDPNAPVADANAQAE